MQVEKKQLFLWVSSGSCGSVLVSYTQHSPEFSVMEVVAAK